MYHKKIRLYSIAILFILGFCIAVTPAVSWSWGGSSKWWKPQVPSEDEMYGWIEDLWEIGDQGQYGYRMPGTPVDIEGAEYILEKFEEFDLEDTFMEPVSIPVNFPDVWSLTTHVGGVDRSIPCGFVRYAAFTPPGGTSGEMIYVGIGSPDDFAVADSASGVAGKIIVVDLIAPGLPMAALDLFDLFTYDPENTLPGDKITENWPVANINSAYDLAAGYGAAGFVGILTFTADDIHQYLHAYVDGSIPGVYISPNDGNDLRNLLLSGTPVEATMVLTGYAGIGETFNVYGFLPGKSDETIVVLSHHDGWATNEASGMSVVMALAKYFTRFPRHHREKSLMFLGMASHFGIRPGLLDMCPQVAAIQDKIIAAISVEMISKQIKIVDGEFIETGLIAPRGLFISGLSGSGNPYLLDFAIDAVIENDLDRTSIQPAAGGLFPHAPGEGGLFDAIGIPTVHLIAHNAPQFTNMDTPETVAKDALVPTTKALRDIINRIDVTPAPLLKWDMTVDDRGIKAYPELREDFWELERPPFGPFDRIGLHRLVKEGIEPEGVVFILPGTWSNGEQLTTNPPEDWWTADEDHSFALYLANRNFDVYAIDYRTHFVNQYLNPPDLGFMAEWGWDEWISDIKEAVELAKAVSGDDRVYIAGDSFGGSAAMNYASMYWKEDLKGILLRDGGTGAKYPELVTDSYNLPEMIAGMVAMGAWAREVGSAPGSIFILQYADQNPTAPAINPYTGDPLEPEINPFTGLPWANIQEWAAFAIYMAWGPGVVSNIYGGYGDPAVMIHIDATFDRYWPSRLSLESAAIGDWDNCPDVSFDFDDHYCEIDVPILAFTSELMGLAYWGPFRHGIANPDFTGIYLWGYGHLDVYSGEYSAVDVSQPTYEWLMSHRMLVGTGKIWCDGGWISGEAAIYINAAKIELRIDDIRVSWDIFSHSIGWMHEIYRGRNDCGRITVIITKKRWSIACGRKVVFMGIRV
jgi:pimeloyl-ACP methyl ester carboxylesterase